METLLAYKDVILGVEPGHSVPAYEETFKRLYKQTNSDKLKFDYEIYYLAYTLFASIPEERKKYSAEELFSYLSEKAKSMPPDNKLYRPLTRLFPPE
jgi:hypothetical protein